jgi:hypothetical protein
MGEFWFIAPVLLYSMVVSAGFFIAGCRFFERRLNHTNKRWSESFDSNVKTSLHDLFSDVEQHKRQLASQKKDIYDLQSELEYFAKNPYIDSHQKSIKLKDGKKKATPKRKPTKKKPVARKENKNDSQDDLQFQVGPSADNANAPREQTAPQKNYELPQAPQPKTSTRRGNPTGRVM